MVVGPASGEFPGGVPGVVAVRSSDAEGRLWVADGGSMDDAVVAPGVEILSLAPQDSYDFFSGESLAAAHLSGIVALLREAAPDLTSRELLQTLRQTSVTPPGHELAIVNACRALERFVPTMCRGGAGGSSSAHAGQPQ